MVFNGLKGADLIIYNYLVQADLSQPISSSQISNATNYHPNYVQVRLSCLQEWGLINRHRPGNGTAYLYTLERY